MKISKHILALALLLFIMVCGAHAQQGQKVKKSKIIENIEGKDYYIHFVKKGETLFAIARAYGITVDDIFKSNPSATGGIYDGKILKMLVRTKETPQDNLLSNKTENPYFYHIVEKKETLYGISRKFGVTIDRIKELNPEMGEYPREGETLKIPVRKEEEDWQKPEWDGYTIPHTIQKGETLYSIARKYSVSIGEIKNANPGLTEKLAIGKMIYIPNQETGMIGGVKAIGIDDEGNEADIETPEKHIVAKGETLYSIARDYATGIDSLKKYNPYLLSHLNIGQEIIIPPFKNDKDFIVHKPEKKRSLQQIADLYEVNYDKIAALNPGISKKAKKGERVKIPVEKKELETKPENETKTADEPDHGDCNKSSAFAGKTFNVALMLPLFLEELDSLNAREETDFGTLSNLISFRFLDFYGGFKMAVDSMGAMGMKINLFVYDVDNQPDKIEQVLLASELGSMDLIVGPLYKQSFNKAAAFARDYQIPIVNPLSNREEVVFGNPYVFKLKPDETFQLDILVDYILEQYPEKNIVLVRNNKYKYQKEISFIRNYLNSKRKSRIYIPNKKIALIIKENEEEENGTSLLTENKLLELEQIESNLTDSTYFTNLVKEVIYVNDSAAGIELNLSKVRGNIVIAISNDIVFSKDVLSQLNKLNLGHDITLFGMPDWNEFSDLETSHLLNLSFHCFTASLVDYNKLQTREWIRKFRKEYKTEPSLHNFAFDGFDTGWYFLNALYRYGPSFTECLHHFNVHLLQGRYRFENQSGNGFQNTYWNVGKYESFDLIRVKTTKPE
ncbi:MAG: LysM peptidoglycan-binding domain-containing protein [Bacteroidales bacterium]|nr:LysM peptidoglycan-binding domain-containing protein [Bacteroidales bacterium]